MRSVVRSVKRGVQRSVRRDEGGGPPPVVTKYYKFDGTSMYATIPTWTPTGLPFEIRAKAIVTTAPTGATQRLYQSPLEVAYGLASLVSGTGGFSYQVIDGAGARQTINAIAGLVSGDSITSSIRAAAEVVCTTNGIVTNTGITPGIYANQSLGYIGILRAGAGQYFGGFIYDLELIDEATPSNSRHYKMDEGTGATIVDSLNPGVNDGTIMNFNEANWQELP